MNKRATENSMLKFLTVSSVSSDSIVKGIIDDIINTAVKLPKSRSKKQNIYNILLINMTQLCQIKQRYTFHLHPAFIE
jgi:ferredoxin-fold anticodon binding domain-containing protein